MRLGLFLVLAGIPFLEIALLIKVGQTIGFWPTFLLVLLSASFGSYVIYAQGFQVMGRAIQAMQQGKTPMAPVIDGMFILFGGVLLIMPGLISDAAGLALLVPRLRHRVAVWGLRRVVKSPELRAFFFGHQHGGSPGGRDPFGDPLRRKSADAPRPPEGDGPIIEGEFERLDERTVDRNRRRDDVRRNGS